jgi:hypothetical protein
MHGGICRLVGSGLVCASLSLWVGCAHSSEQGCSCCDHDHSHADHHASTDDTVETVEPTGHTHTGPSGGRLIVLGDEEYHAELVIDHAKGEAVVRILDHTGRKPVGTEQRTITLNFKCKGHPHQIQLVAVECPEGPRDMSFCFTGTSDLLRGECELTGRLNVIIGGKPYTGRVAHREEDHNLIR